MVALPSMLLVLSAVAQVAGPRPAVLAWALAASPARTEERLPSVRVAEWARALVVLLPSVAAAGGAGVGSGAGVVGCAGCGTTAIDAVGGVGSEAGGPATDGAGAIPSAGTFLTDEAEGCGATDCPLSLRRQ